MTDDWPSHTEELARKTSALLGKWTKMYESKKITKRDYFIVVDVLYDATSGLVPSELSNLLADIHQFLRLEGKNEKK